MATQGIPPPLLELIKNTFNTRYTSLAAMAVVLFEHVITADQEYELIWSKPWSRSKALFIWNRYMTLAVMLVNTVVWVGGGKSDAYCKRWFLFQGMTGWLTNMTVQVIIQIRIAALFGKNKKVVYPMVAGFVLEAVTMISIVGWQLSERKAQHQPAPGIRICVLDRVPPYMWSYWLINIVYEGVLLILALYKAYQNWKYGTVDVRWSKKSASIFEILIRDSILYFFLIFCTYLLNLVSWYIGTKSLYQIAIALAIGIRCAMGARLLLNIREAYYRGPSTGMTTGGEKTNGYTYDLPTMKAAEGSGSNKQRRGNGGISELDTQWALDTSRDAEDELAERQGRYQSESGPFRVERVGYHA